MVFTGGVRDGDADYAEFVAAWAGRLRRQAYGRCGDWARADRVTRQVLLDLHRRWASASEPPDEYVQRTLARLLRRAPGGFPADGPAPLATFTADGLLATGRSRRRVRRAAVAVATVLVVAVGGLATYVLRPAPDGTPILVEEDCKAGLPALATPSPMASALGGDAGIDRLTALSGDLPLPGPTVLPEQARRERLGCELAAYFRTRVNPDGLERADVGLGSRDDPHPLAALLDPQIGPAALTVAVRVASASGIGTVTVSVAPTRSRPGPQHCARLAICQLSSTTQDGRVVEQYGVRESPEAVRAGFRLGAQAEWWSVAVYSGRSLVLVTITNTPDVRAALPSSTPFAPIGEQVVALASEPGLAVFDPPASSGPPAA